jgi:hypothetical protein
MAADSRQAVDLALNIENRVVALDPSSASGAMTR